MGRRDIFLLTVPTREKECASGVEHLFSDKGTCGVSERRKNGRMNYARTTLEEQVQDRV